MAVTAHRDILEYARLLKRYLRPHWIKAILLAVTLFTSIGLQLAGPQILRFFIDSAMEGRGLDLLGWAALLYLSLAVANQVFSASATYLGADIGWTSTNELRRDLAEHCIRLDMGFHNDRTPGELIERIDGDVTNLSNFFSQFTIQILGSILLTLGVLLLLLRESLIVGTGLTFFAIVAFLLLLKLRNLAIPLFQRLVLMLLFALANLLAIGSGVYMHQHTAISVGTVFLFFHYTEMLRMPVMQLTRQLQDLQNAGAGIARVNELMNLRNAIPTPGDKKLHAGPLAIDFEDVSFRYRESVPVLRDMTLRLAPGRLLGIVGKTGSGKTTVARLLFRLYDAQQGAIRIGGRNIRDLELAGLRGLARRAVRAAYGVGGRSRAQLRPHRRGAPADRQSVEGLPATRRHRPGDHP